MTYSAWIGIALVVSALTSAAAGHRAHLWLRRHAPALGDRLPVDAGAWTGLVLGVALAIAFNAEDLVSLACGWRDFGICAKADPALVERLMSR